MKVIVAGLSCIAAGALLAALALHALRDRARRGIGFDKYFDAQDEERSNASEKR